MDQACEAGIKLVNNKPRFPVAFVVSKSFLLALAPDL